MLSRSLQWVGLITVFVSLLIAIGLFMLVKDRIDVTIQSADSSDAPDPLALVSDDLQVLHGDLDAIAKGLDSNLQQIGAALEQIAQQDEGSAQAIARLTTLVKGLGASTPGSQTADLKSVQNDITRLGDTLTAIANRLEGSGAGISPNPLGGEKPRVANQPIESKAAVSVVSESSPVASTVVEAPPVRPGGSFLSFKLPSASLDFDQPVHYRVIPSLSRVGFDGKSTLHDFTGVTSSVSGDVYANLADPQFVWHGAIECQAVELHTGVDGRDEEMHEYLEVKRHPDIHFEIIGFEPDPSGVDIVAKTVRGVVNGEMTIRGKTRDLRMPVSISFDLSRRAVVTGDVALKLSDYEVPVANKLGLISMEDGVRIWIELRARMVGAAGEKHEGR